MQPNLFPDASAAAGPASAANAAVEQQPFLYLRGLKHADHTVFSVQDGQKRYYDPQFERTVPYSSGQQVKRSLLDTLRQQLQVAPAPTTFVFDVSEKKGKQSLDEGEVLSACDPRYADQLLGGWMAARAASATAGDQDKGGEKKERTLKRRSPLSISAMRPLHPLLGTFSKENLTFDRRETAGQNKVVVRGTDGKPLTEEAIAGLLDGVDRSLFMKWIPDAGRTSGLFVHDVAIDLRTLFCVSTNSFEPEVPKAILTQLRDNGWQTGQNAFGECLVCPAAERERIIPALAYALLNWRITSNQARTFSPMETLAVAISDNANRITGAIRAKLDPENEKKALPIVEQLPGTEVFVTLAGAGYFRTYDESADALDRAAAHLMERLRGFNYEGQPAAK
ncbi:CRISPR-associated protein Cas7 [Hymenobacter psoromatis]|uniref:CRISPR-associated protein Cas7 n=1 Tax=Hymenobacter psoromatis TaxID=1484116 RepID=UPI001CBF6512|nr:CRISPR-associated protein Cas7 [Hymenobacter psoromatis]